MQRRLRGIQRIGIGAVGFGVCRIGCGRFPDGPRTARACVEVVWEGGCGRVEGEGEGGGRVDVWVAVGWFLVEVEPLDTSLSSCARQN